VRAFAALLSRIPSVSGLKRWQWSQRHRSAPFPQGRLPIGAPTAALTGPQKCLVRACPVTCRLGRQVTGNSATLASWYPDTAARDHGRMQP